MLKTKLLSLFFKIEDQPLEYALQTIKKNRLRIIFYKTIYYFINIVSLIANLALAILSPIIISKLVWTNYPTWFILLGVYVSAGMTFLSSLLNFFIIDKRILEFVKKSGLYEYELFLFQEEYPKYKTPDREMLFFNNINKIKFVEVTL